jgi:putative transposase
MANHPGPARPKRLTGFDYNGPLVAHLTFVASQRRDLFANGHLAALCLGALEEARDKTSAIIHAYCLMPDHVHLLVEIPERQTLTAFAKRFKQLSGHRLKRDTGDFAWQPGYHDRVLRDEESILDVAWYIWDNPAKAGLVTAFREYLYSGPRDVLEAVLQG